MEPCTKCNGVGLIGSGPNPIALEGQKVKCDMCAGTGKVGATSADPEVAPEQPVAVEPEATEPDPETAPEESPKEPEETGSAESSSTSEESNEQGESVDNSSTE